MDSAQPATKVAVVAMAPDGGSLVITVQTSNAVHRLIQDNRVDAPLRGEIWTGYPGSIGGQLIDPDSPLAVSIKLWLVESPPS